VDTKQEVKRNEDDTDYRHNGQPTMYTEKKIDIIEPVTNTVAINDPVATDWDVIENEMKMIKTQPIKRMHRPSTFKKRPHQEVTRDNPNQLKQAIDRETSYNHPKTGFMPVIGKYNRHPTKPVINEDKMYRSSQEKTYSQPKNIKKKISSKLDEYANTNNANTATSKYKSSPSYSDTSSQASSNHPKVTAHKYRAKSSYNDRPRQPAPKTTHEKSLPVTRVSKISARHAQDSLEGESHQPRYGLAGPAGQGSLEAAVVAGAAGYNAERYDEPQRLSFQIHGQEGPHSYRFGHDTGVGYNRQFRYEERDNSGVVHGRYGYYDQAGKLQVVNYTADPHSGFHAEGEHVPKPQYRR